jgi:hypothetical protein
MMQHDAKTVGATDSDNCPMVTVCITVCITMSVTVALEVSLAVSLSVGQWSEWLRVFFAVFQFSSWRYKLSNGFSFPSPHVHENSEDQDHRGQGLVGVLLGGVWGEKEVSEQCTLSSFFTLSFPERIPLLECCSPGDVANFDEETTLPIFSDTSSEFP